MSEQLPNPEQAESKGWPSIEEIVGACRGVLTEEDVEDLHAMEPEEAFGYLMFLLPERGQDPEQFLIEAGLAEGFQPDQEESS